MQNRLASYVSRTKRKKNWVPKFFWAAGEAFFSDLGHFSEFEDFSKFEDFGCLKHITLANHHTAVMKERLTLCSSQKHVYGINLLLTIKLLIVKCLIAQKNEKT